MVNKSGILYCAVANGSRVLVSRRLRDGNFVQVAKRILTSGLELDGDHCRSYRDDTGHFAFHALVRRMRKRETRGGSWLF